MPLEQPQARISLNGQYIYGLVELDIQSSTAFSAGRFLLKFAVGFSESLSVDEFISFDGGFVSIEIANNSFSYVEIMTGYVENINFDFLENTATLQGRDLTSILIDSSIEKSFVNQSASDIAANIAQKYGLTPNIGTTSDLVGQYYQIDHTKSGLNINSRANTVWDLLCKLAVLQNFVVFVTNNILNFIQVDLDIQAYLNLPSFLDLGVDLIGILPKSVQLKSWNSREKSVVEQSIGSGQAIKIIQPNLTIDKVAQYASSYMNIIKKNQRIIAGSMPGDTDLKTMSAIRLDGTGSSLDGAYLVESLRRRINSRDGFVQFMRASAVNI